MAVEDALSKFTPMPKYDYMVMCLNAIFDKKVNVIHFYQSDSISLMPDKISIVTGCVLFVREVYAGSSVRSVSQHLMLKCCALAVVTPFIAASLVETVQSSVASEGPGIFDVFREGLTRLLSFTQPQTG